MTYIVVALAGAVVGWVLCHLRRNAIENETWKPAIKNAFEQGKVAGARKGDKK